MQANLVLALFFASSFLWSAEETGSGVLPICFEGYLVVGDSVQLSITVRKHGRITAQSWSKIGDLVSGIQLEKFERKSETLTVSDRDGRKYELRLPDARSSESAGSSITPAQHSTAMARAVREIEEYRKTIREKLGNANVTVDIDGSLLPEERKRTYAQYQAKAAEQGRTYFPVCVDGKWFSTLVPNRSSRPSAESLEGLTEREVAEVRLRWQIASAELAAVGMVLPPGKHQLPSRPAPDAKKVNAQL